MRVLGCASGPSRFVFRQVLRGSVRIGIHRRLTIRSSRPHVVASAACFTLRLHASAAPPRVGLTQALGDKKHSAVALPAVQVFGFAQHCSSDGSWARCLFGQVRDARSHVACVALAGFGSDDHHLPVFPHLIHCFGHGRLQIFWRAQAAGLRFSVSASAVQRRGLPSRLTSRSSRPRVVASATCYALRLHVSAAPPQGGLTPALGGKEH